MDLKKINSILNNSNKEEVFYNDRPCWIQSVDSNIAKIRFY